MAQPLTPAFDPRAGTEAILYLAAAINVPTLHAVLKLRYMADKMHLGRYGQVASGDSYVAMEFGPVASHTYHLMQAARGDESVFIDDEYRAIAHEAFSIAEDGISIIAKRPPHLDYIADSDRACLDEAIAKYGCLNFNQRVLLSHGKAWEEAWRSRTQDQRVAQMPTVSIARELDNADEVLEHLHID